MLELTEIAGTRLRVSAEPLAFAERHRPEINAYWDQLTSANPRLWNGPAYLFEAVRIEDGNLCGEARLADFSTFLFWRDNGRGGSVCHITGTSLPITRDDCLLAVRMAAHTANAGQVYFPAGSFDALDMVDDMLDPLANIIREMEEETGIRLDRAWFTGPMLLVEHNGSFHIAQSARMPFEFAECAQRFAAHQTKTGDDEIEALVPVRSASHSVADLKPYAARLARHVLGA